MSEVSTAKKQQAGVQLLLLHPTGSVDPRDTSLAVGVLEWIRQWLERRGLRSTLWPETAINSTGQRRFILRSTPWSGQEIRRKLELVPTAEGALYLNVEADRGRSARVSLDDRRGDHLVESTFPFNSDGIYDRLPETMRSLFAATERPAHSQDSSEFFFTTDRQTALASLYALERVVATQVGVGREDPKRMFEPALQCLQRDAAHPIARDCLLRIGQSMLETQSQEERHATFEAYQRWSELAPVSPLPPFYIALAYERAGQQGSARGAFEEALRRDPLFGPALQEYALWLGKRGFLDQGVAVLKSAIGRTGIDGALMDQTGCLLANAGRIDEAEPFFRASIQAGGPKTAFANLARGLMARDHPDDALEILTEAIETNPESSQIALLGEIAKGDGMASAKARAILRGRGIQSETDENLLRELTMITMGMDGEKAAIPHARRLLSVSRDPELRRFAYYVILKASLPDLDSRWDTAVKDTVEGDAVVGAQFFREVLECEPEFNRARFFLAASLERQGRIREALPHLEKVASSEEGDDPEVLDLLARARSDVGNVSGAAQAHHRAAAGAPANPRILRNAAISLLRAGYYGEGASLAGASLALHPEQPDLLELLRQTSHQRGSRLHGWLSTLRQRIKKVRGISN